MGTVDISMDTYNKHQKIKLQKEVCKSIHVQYFKKFSITIPIRKELCSVFFFPFQAQPTDDLLFKLFEFYFNLSFI